MFLFIFGVFNHPWFIWAHVSQQQQAQQQRTYDQYMTSMRELDETMSMV
jgi:hypothetical protein